MNQYYNTNNQFNQNQPYYTAPAVNLDYQREVMAREYYKQKRRKERNQIIGEGFVFGAAIIAFLIIETIIVTSLQASGNFSLYENSALFQNCFNIVAVHLTSIFIPFALVSLIFKKRYNGPVVPTKPIGKLKAFAWVSIGMGCCLGANYITNAVILLFKSGGYELSQPELLDADSIYTCIAMIFSTAVVPAIFEEFAMRCSALGILKNHGKGFGVVAVSIVFGLIHGNVIQFVFAFTIGLILGYITVKTDNVIPAMLIHGFNNGLSVTQEIVSYTSSEKTAEYVIGTIMVTWIVFAVWGLIYLFVKKDLFIPREKKIKEPYALSFGAKLLCLLPGFFIPFVILIVLTMQYVQPIK